MTTDLATTDLATTELATTDLVTPDLATTDSATTDLATTDLVTPEWATDWATNWAMTDLAVQYEESAAPWDGPVSWLLPPPATTRRTDAEPAAAEPATTGPRTAAGERAFRRRRARLTAFRRPPSGLLPSTSRTSATVSAGSDHLAHLVGYRMGRLARLTTTVLTVAAAAILIRSLLAPSPETTVVPVRVVAGDTLWSIAAMAQPAAETGLVVRQIEEMNGLDSDVLAVGTLLQVRFAPEVSDKLSGGVSSGP